MATPPRPRIVDPDARIFPIEAASLVGISRQRLSALSAAGHFPRPEADGRYKLGEFIREFIRYVEESTREEATAQTTRDFLGF